MKYVAPDKIEPSAEGDAEVPPSHSLLTIAKLVAWLKAPFMTLGRKLNGGHGEDDRMNEKADD